MKPQPLPALTIGLDLVSAETGLPEGAVRRARNITIRNNGDWQARPGAVLLAALPGAHSYWRSPAQTRALVAAGTTLYDVDPATGATAAIFTSLPYEQPVEYCDVGPDIYFTSAGVLRKIAPDGTVRIPGVADLIGTKPTLAATTGGLPAGRYGVAYSLVNDLGEESGVSSIRWIDLTTGGIAVSGLQSAPDAAKVNVYCTTQNGDLLYRHSTFPVAATATIAGPHGLAEIERETDRQFLRTMPGGSIVRLFNGRLWTVDGKWICYSRALDFGVTDTRKGWMSFNRTITNFEPVAGGIFVTMRERTIFLAGNGPGDFRQTDIADHGGAEHTGGTARADYFNPDLVPDRSQAVACWLSDAGLAVGRPDGSLAFPQAGRLRVDAGAGRPLFFQQLGLKQGVFLTDSLTLGVGGATDTTI